MSTLKLYGWAEEEGKDVVFTPWTLVHVAAGYVAKSVGVDIVEFNLFHGLYECKDMFLKQEVCNSVPNSVGDQPQQTLLIWWGQNFRELNLSVSSSSYLLCLRITKISAESCGCTKMGLLHLGALRVR